MRLMAVRLQNYRRFEKPVKVDVAGDVVAIVGPNEAGKSTILSAMISHDQQEEFSHRERTRHSTGGTEVVAEYVLDDEDRKALSGIPNGDAVRWWALAKEDDGDYTFSLHPAPERDLSPRKSLAAKLLECATKELVPHLNDPELEEVVYLYQQAQEALSTDAEDLDDDEEEAIRTFGTTLATLPVASSGAKNDHGARNLRISSRFKKLLDEMVGYDEGDDPHTLAGLRLTSRRPQFLEFRTEEREIKTTYDLMSEIDDPALTNLARLAGLDLKQLLQASQSRNRALRTSMLERANEELKAIFQQAWHQHDVSVHLGIEGNVLEVLVSLPEGGFTEIEERSSGLRTFIALRAFMDKHKQDPPPILLVDEAETHLHYDAQADLIDMFTNQEFASKVIYTTHSAGCLPRDLGTGVRVVVPYMYRERSYVKNSIWSENEAGFTPLAFGMGATTFAFLPSRHVVLVEGITDAMLYPTLFREASGRPNLRFQVAPGLAVVRPAHAAGLLSEGGAVQFIVDGDQDGKRYRQQLLRADVSDRCIFGLGTFFGADSHLEDLVDENVYLVTVDRILENFVTAGAAIETGKLSTPGRAQSLRAWCRRRQLPELDKRKVVQEMLDQKSMANRRGEYVQILSEDHRDRMVDLLKGLEVGFGR